MLTQAFLDILVENLTPGQHQALLQAFTNAVHKHGECPCCGTADVPIDHAGTPIEGDDVSGASEWIEAHDDDCPIALFERAVEAQETVR